MFPSLAPQTLEGGKRYGNTTIIEDAVRLGRKPGPIKRLIVYGKKYIHGVSILYEDGSSTGLIAGWGEQGVTPTSQVLDLQPGERLVLIAGYCDTFIGVIHIKTTRERTLDIGQDPRGTEFVLQIPGQVIEGLAFGMSDYLSFISARFSGYDQFPTPPGQPAQTYETLPQIVNAHSSGPGSFTPASYPPLPSPAFEVPTTFPPPLMPQPIPGPMPHPMPGPMPHPMPAPMPHPMPGPEPERRFEVTEQCGYPNGTAEAFDDYEKVIKPNLAKGSKVRLATLVVFYNSAGIMGLETTYEIKDVTGKVTKVTETHKKTKASCSKSKCTLAPTDTIARLQGKQLFKINKLKVILNSGKQAIDCGQEEGAEFLILPMYKGPILAFAGSVGDALYTLRCYAQMPDITTSLPNPTSLR